MCDLVDHHAREMMLDLTGERRPVPETGRAGPAEPAGAVSAGPASQVHAGAGTVSHGAATALSSHVTMRPAEADAVMLAAVSHFAALLDWSVALAAKAGPIPLAAAEPWVEGDEAYRERLSQHRLQLIETPDHALDVAGHVLGLPRARLVLTACVPVEIRP